MIQKVIRRSIWHLCTVHLSPERQARQFVLFVRIKIKVKGEGVAQKGDATHYTCKKCKMGRIGRCKMGQLIRPQLPTKLINLRESKKLEQRRTEGTNAWPPQQLRTHVYLLCLRFLFSFFDTTHTAIPILDNPPLRLHRRCPFHSCPYR